MEFIFRELQSNEKPPMELLLLADPSKDMIMSYLEKGICYVVVYRNDVIGVALVVKKDLQRVEIVNIAIAENYQQRGIGKKLLLYVIDEIEKENIKEIEIGTGNSSVGQLLLYQKCGFRIVGIDFDFFRNNYSEKIYENGIECRDMIRLKKEIE